jgi:hypothetical protein
MDILNYLKTVLDILQNRSERAGMVYYVLDHHMERCIHLLQLSIQQLEHEKG